MKKNSLLEIYPDLAAQWHPTKNGFLTPDDISYRSSKSLWWLLPYDDPTTGSHFDFVWKNSIYNRVHHENGCPYLSGRKAWPGFNDLLSQRPDIAREWDYEKNAPLTPEMVTVSSNRRIWWLLPYDDPKTGKHFDFSWNTKVNDRTRYNIGCPFLSGHKVWPGFNDLASREPELIKQWDYEKNAPLTPDMVSYRSTKKVWWLLSYDDPNTGRHFDFSWYATVYNRSL